MPTAHILIVEDEIIVAQDIQRRLKELGYAIAGTAVSGEQAIQQAEADRPDLVLMDIQLKGELDGIQAAQYIHQQFDLPVVYLTAHSDEATLQRAKITEPFGYILKPFEERELHTNIEMALHKHKLEQELRWQASVNAALAALGKALISPMALDDISAIVLERAKQLTGSAFGFVGYIDPKTGHFVSSTMTRDIWDACQVADKSVIFTKFSGLWGWVLQNRQSLIANTPSQDPRSGGIPQGHVPVERFLGAPAMLDDRLVGMIALANPPRDYTERDLAVAERLAALYAVAIQRARMEQELEEWNRTLEQRVIERTEQLRQSEARVRHLYENSPVMMHTTDENDIICDVNAQWLQETGYSREQVIGRNIYFLLTPESAERYMENQPRLQREGRARDVPYQFIMQSGTVMDVLVNIETTREPSGQIISLSVVRNVTEQRQAERRLRLQSAALESAANAIAITNRFGRISWVNPAFTQLTGYTLDEAAGQTMRLLKSGQHDVAFYKHMWDTILAGQVWHGEVVNRRKDGSLYVEEQTITPVRDERGEISHFACIKQDVTQRKQMQAALQQSEAQYRALFENAPIGIYRTTPEGQILAANPALIHMLGYASFEELAQLNLEQGGFTPEQPRRQFVELMEREGRVQGLEYQWLRRDGAVIHVRENASAQRAPDGAVLYYEGTVEDITEHKHMQAKMMHADRLSAVGKLAASVAHEINNPLQSVIGCLGLAQEALTEEDEDPAEYLQVAREEVLRIKRIVARMRDLYRPESGEKKMTEVDTLLAQVLELARKRCQESQIVVDWQPAANLPPALLAPDQIKQVFLNLLLNAIDAMPNGGQLRVSVAYTPAPPGLRVQFSDTGTGIPPDVLPRIFETFYSTKPEGTGLGLSISQNIINEHGGRIDVESEPGQGSTFSVWLPVA